MNGEHNSTEILEAILAYAEKNDAQIANLRQELSDVKITMAAKEDVETAKIELNQQMLSVGRAVNDRVDLLVQALDQQGVLRAAQTAHLVTANPFPKPTT